MWCDNDKNNFNAHNNMVAGQIDPNMPVGKTIIDTIKRNQLRTILDIGTWNGLGSTKCFLIALEDNPSTSFISIESNKDKNLIAKNNLSEFLSKNKNADLCWGTILKPDDITNIGDIFPEYLENSEYQRWHALDMENLKLSPYIFDKIPDELDFVLFDGGEFTTYFEFFKLFPKCKKFIALDDVHALKCDRIRDYLNSHNEWEEVEYINERNGFSLFKKR